MMSLSRVLVLNEQSDNVGIALAIIDRGDSIQVQLHHQELQFSAIDPIPAGHKIALVRIHRDELVVKYGYPIGRASQGIEQGQHVHGHNLKSMRGKELTTGGTDNE